MEDDFRLHKSINWSAKWQWLRIFEFLFLNSCLHFTPHTAKPSYPLTFQLTKTSQQQNLPLFYIQIGSDRIWWFHCWNVVNAHNEDRNNIILTLYHTKSTIHNNSLLFITNTYIYTTIYTIKTTNNPNHTVFTWNNLIGV